MANNTNTDLWPAQGSRGVGVGFEVKLKEATIDLTVSSLGMQISKQFAMAMALF